MFLLLHVVSGMMASLKLGTYFPRTCILLFVLSALHCIDGLSVGRGIADVTGLISEGALYGYADPTQDARGMHTRQYSRAFVFDDGNKVAAFVVVEVAMISQAVHKGVMEHLQAELGDIFTEDNVLLSPTHTHSLPGGFHTFWMYQIVSNGFINETYDALVAGISQSIITAYGDLKPGKLLINSGQLWDASANRSPYAYWNNPPEELAEYGDEDTDKTMVLLKMQDAQDADMGMISFFGVHPTSMKNFNHLVSSDNKGYAVIMMEKYLNPGAFPGKGSILAAFTQTSEGDSTPNTDGERCEDTNDFCAYNTSSCPEAPLNPRLCTGRGPSGEQFEDTRIIGEKQYLKAKELFESASEILDGPIDYRQQWVNMSGIPVVGEGGFAFTCRPAMGYSFAAGAADGPGIPPFTQGRLEPIDFIENATSIAFNKSEEHYACHLPKPVLLPTGTIEIPFPWQPEILPIQLLRIGGLVLIGVPAEVTTMSGRRLQKAVKRVLVNNGIPDTVRTLVISMSNSFSSYLTTFEEYQVQRYEGASNTFGQHTLQAYTRLFENLAYALATGASVDKGPTPPDLRGYPKNALRDIKIDLLPTGSSYGDIINDVLPTYKPGETANVTFVSGNPRNNLMTDRTFLEVQRRDESETEWVVEFVDSQWETKLYWDSACHEGRPGPGTPQNCTLLGQESTTTIVWDIPSDQQEGLYRIRHYGNARRPIGPVVQYVGTSTEFQVVSNDQRKIKSKSI